MILVGYNIILVGIILGIILVDYVRAGSSL